MGTGTQGPLGMAGYFQTMGKKTVLGGAAKSSWFLLQFSEKLLEKSPPLSGPQFLYGKVRGLQDNLIFSGLGSGISEKLLERFPTSLREITILPTAVAIAAHLQPGRGSFLFSLWILCLHIEG